MKDILAVVGAMTVLIAFVVVITGAAVKGVEFIESLISKN